MNEKRKILIINTSGLGIGGITIHMLNYINILRHEYKNLNFTIIVTGIFDREIIERFRNLDCKMLFFPDRKKSPVRYAYALNREMHEANYDVIHVHGNSSTMTLELLIAKKYGIKVRIAHCHNSICNHMMLNKVLMPVFKRSYTHALACSQLAGDWIFGQGKFEVLHNAIDMKKFSYDPVVRSEYRKQLGVADDTTILGHIGNINEQKNHEFLIRVFERYQKVKKSELILIGKGPLEDEIKCLVKKLELENKVHFLGLRNDVSAWMQAMDCFVFPSRWEGLGMVLIEAQAAGLPVVASKAPPQEVKIKNNFVFLDLDQGFEKWSEQIEMMIKNTSRSNNVNTGDANVYDIKQEKEKLYKIYGGVKG